MSSITPQFVETAGNVVVLINGTDFGTVCSATVGPFTCGLTGVACQQTYLQCLLPPGQGANLPVVVTVGGQSGVANGTSGYTYAPPNISSITPTGARSGAGVFLTVYGASFGLSGSVTGASAGCAAGEC